LRRRRERGADPDERGRFRSGWWLAMNGEKTAAGRQSPLRLRRLPFAPVPLVCLGPRGNLFGRQFLQKFVAQAIKATIRHHQQQIVGARFGGEKISDSV